MGVRRGDRVSILAHNHLAHLDLILATAKLGFIYAPFNTRLSVAEQRGVAAYLRPKLLFCDEAHEEKAEATGLALVSLETYTAWLRAEPLPYPPAQPQNEDTQMILLTSGSAGQPRGVMQPYRQGLLQRGEYHLSRGGCARTTARFRRHPAFTRASTRSPCRSYTSGRGWCCSEPLNRRSI